MSLRQIVCLGLIWIACACTGSAQEPQKDIPPPPAAAVPQRIRVGGKVQQAKLLHFVQPEYPADAKKKGIQGTVLLHTIIGKDGTMAQIQFVSGPSELMRETVALSTHDIESNPVEVDTTIAVVFTLSGRDGATSPQ